MDILVNSAGIIQIPLPPEKLSSALERLARGIRAFRDSASAAPSASHDALGSQ